MLAPSLLVGLARIGGRLFEDNMVVTKVNIPRLPASDDVSVKSPLTSPRVDDVRKAEKVMLENLTNEQGPRADTIPLSPRIGASSLGRTRSVTH